MIVISDDHFTAAASGATAGVMRIFASGQGQSAVRGTISGGQLVPSTYESSIVTDKKYDEVRMIISSGTVKRVRCRSADGSEPRSVPLTDAHRRNVSDPMTASIFAFPALATPPCRRPASARLRSSTAECDTICDLLSSGSSR